MNREEFEAWKALKTTREVEAAVASEIKAIMESWHNLGMINFDSPNETAMKNAYWLGKVHGLKSFLDIQFDEREEDGL